MTYNNDAPDTSSFPSVGDILKLLEPVAIQHNNTIQDLVGLTTAALKTTVDTQIKRRLKTWTSSRTSNRIWIQGPHNVSHPSQNTLTAACLVGLANNAKIPCISFFGSLQSRGSHGAYPSPPDLLLDMVKSLIIQLLLLQDPGDYLDAQLEDFGKLLVNPVDLSEALGLLHELRGLVPQHLLCVIESVQELEDRGDGSHTANLRKVLREIINLGQSHRREPQPVEGEGAGTEEVPEKSVKVCFTSDGHADVLAVAAQGGFLDKVAWDADDEAGEGEQLGSLWDDETGSDG
ncbi:hypothetical protein PG991_016042 [Apiospora marii]|uniref:Uncharacterized protein n=2 Tax=Apiospora marii TaxID=335849 RepID=A0ABR1R130_9PEZI